MALIKAESLMRRYFDSRARISVRKIKGWVERGEVAGKIVGNDVWVDEASFCEGSRESIDRPQPALESELRRIFVRTQRQAKRRQIPWDLTTEDLFRVWRSQAGRCAVSGVRMTLAKSHAPGARRPWAPSVDRVDSKHGYTRKNTRLVCVAANLAMNEWGERVLIDLARAIVEKKGGGYGG